MSLNTTQIYLDYFDDNRKKDFVEDGITISKKIEILSMELEKLKQSVNG